MNLKEDVGIKAASYVKDGMTVGLGTGSTAYYMIKEIGRKIKEEKLNVVGVPTSTISKQQAAEIGIPIKSIDEVKKVDLIIDGADEINTDYQGIKGGGAALLFEKIVATYTDQVIWIVDESKMVNKLGEFPLPVEVIPYGQHQLFHLFAQKGYHPSFRMENDQMKVTDSGHSIIDLNLTQIDHPEKLAKELDETVGVVEHGLFLNMVNTVIIGRQSGAQIVSNIR
ncbi:ribose-5-phosphate isomerase RpiA [Tetragenococcus muriaticus]|uniref:Ribose-5-phosphate isomerase A n=2 Tax=Tetragenococcus muriaticus TaxID=64642 RepID=A0A091BVC7_9ENTE|nr:ribose-5-phosphate isomerase RpiA [Tetragenococcus muriaticus]KFN89606.1 ribose 5-phosphate isomerase A [Tetragenococcus muriaticus 3MR10-3]